MKTIKNFETFVNENIKNNKKIINDKSCSCNDGMIDCPACKDDKDSHKYNCAACHGKGKVVCGKCGGKNKL